MFSLITVLLAIGLAVALAVATLWFGGNAFNQGAAEARATTLVNQGQQLLSAAELFYTEHQRYPNNLNELVAGGYLNAIPQPPQQASLSDQLVGEAAAVADTLAWEQLSPGVPAYWINRRLPERVCKTINLKVRGDNGILREAVPSHSAQCFGTAAPYTVIVFKPQQTGTDAVSLTQAFTNAGTGLAASANGGAWTVAPSTPGCCAWGGPGSANGGGNDAGSGGGSGDSGGGGSGGGGSGSGSEPFAAPTLTCAAVPKNQVSCTLQVNSAITLKPDFFFGEGPQTAGGGEESGGGGYAAIEAVGHYDVAMNWFPAAITCGSNSYQVWGTSGGGIPIPAATTCTISENLYANSSSNWVDSAMEITYEDSSGAIRSISASWPN